LIVSKAEAAARDADNNTPLMLAKSKSHAKLVSLLAPMEARDPEGRWREMAADKSRLPKAAGVCVCALTSVTLFGVALKGEPLAQEMASKTDVTILSWHTP